MEPTIVTEVAPPGPTGRAVIRLVQTLLVERRLPWRARRAWDRAARAMGLRLKTVRTGGLRVTVRRGDYDEDFVQNVLVCGEYNPPGYEIGAADVVVDVGANIGSFTLRAAIHAPRGRVVAVEPAAGNFALLRKNLHRNRLHNVTAVHAAVMDQPGSVTLYLNRLGSGSHSVHASRGTGPVEAVPAVTLPGLFAAHGIDRCDFLKVDCEGAEHAIFHALDNAFLSRVRRVAMEFHSQSDATKRVDGDALVDRLERAGFTVDRYEIFAQFRGGLIRARRAD